MIVVLIGVGRTVSTLVVLSTLEGETIGTVCCVCGVSGRVLSSESETLWSVIPWEVSSWMDVVPSRLIPPLLNSSCEPLFLVSCRAVCGFAQLGFLIRRFARGGHKLVTVYVQSQSGFLQAVRAAVEGGVTLRDDTAKVGRWIFNMLEKREEGNSYPLKSESRMNLQLHKSCRMIDITSPANPTDCMDFVCRGSKQVMQLSK